MSDPQCPYGALLTLKHPRGLAGRVLTMWCGDGVDRFFPSQISTFLTIFGSKNPDLAVSQRAHMAGIGGLGATLSAPTATLGKSRGRPRPGRARAGHLGTSRRLRRRRLAAFWRPPRWRLGRAPSGWSGARPRWRRQSENCRFDVEVLRCRRRTHERRGRGRARAASERGTAVTSTHCFCRGGISMWFRQNPQRRPPLCAQN